MRLKLKPGRQSGFPLLEVVIAILILAIGLLGLASLQAVSLQMNHSAYSRAQASNLAYEMADRMRSNPDGDYSNVDFVDPVPVCNLTLQAQSNITDQDILEWRNALACTLPMGNGEIEIGSDDMVTIRVQWDDSRDENAEPFEFALRTRL